MATVRHLEGVDLINRLGLLALLYSLERMCEQKDFEGMQKVVTKLLAEAESEKKSEKKD